MACKQWCFFARGCIVGFTIIFVLSTALPAIAESEFIYNYDVDGGGQGNTFEHLFYTQELDGVILQRRQKRSIEPPPPPRPRTIASSTILPSTVPVQSSQNPIHDQTVIKSATGTSVNVTYSTDNTTNLTTFDSSSTPVITTQSSTTLKPDVEKNGKNSSIVVSQPINPTNSQPMSGTIWANQTQWANATRDNNTPKIDVIPQVNITKTTETPTNSSELDDISINQFSGQVSNNTLAQNNITKQEIDTHQYYNSTFIVDEKVGKEFWVDINNHPEKKVNDLLSESHRRAATVKLKFDFPFYGHKVRNITIATGGFLYTGEYVHSWLAATQYIAPLMANFDTRLSIDSYVKYADNGTAFTVEWEKVKLQDKPDVGPFTFQATLHENGNIVFVYSEMPLLVKDIEDKAHPVKVGLSDAYIMDRTVFFVRRKTIYEYHRVNFNRQQIKNWTTIYLTALPTCLKMENCSDCLTKVPDFACKWCPELNQCSTGTSRFRQDWLEKDCDQRSIKEVSMCPANPKILPEHLDVHDRVITDPELSASVEPNRLSKEPSILEHPAHGPMNISHMGVSGIISVLLIVSMVMGLIGWAGYAYRNPHSTSGQMLIRYRPSQWTWRRGEARYTAATIHM